VDLPKERKIVYYGLLTYIAYGVSYIFILKDFVVPLPLIYLLVPGVALYFFVRSITSIQALLFLFLPLVVMKDLLFEWPEKWVELITFLGIISWSMAGFLIIRTQNSSTLKNILGYHLLLTPLVLLPFLLDYTVWWFISIAILSLIYLQSDDTPIDTKPEKTHYRIILLVFLMNALFAITFISRWLT
jgi:hypothetical protein